MGLANFLRELFGRSDLAAEKDRVLDLNKLKLQEEFARAREKVAFSVQFALLVLRGLTIINGGAIIALFTFLGAATQNGTPLTLSHVGLLWWAFGFFSVGLSSAILSSFLSYMAQYHQADAEYSSPYNNYIDMTGADDPKLDYKENISRFRLFRRGAFGSAFCSLLMFVIGSATALSSALPASHRHESERRVAGKTNETPKLSASPVRPEEPAPVSSPGTPLQPDVRTEGRIGAQVQQK